MDVKVHQQRASASAGSGDSCPTKQLAAKSSLYLRTKPLDSSKVRKSERYPHFSSCFIYRYRNIRRTAHNVAIYSRQRKGYCDAMLTWWNHTINALKSKLACNELLFHVTSRSCNHALHLKHVHQNLKMKHRQLIVLGHMQNLWYSWCNKVRQT